jgi:hypothetical protein
VLITLVFNQAITVVAAKQRIGIGKMPKQKENMLDTSIEFNPSLHTLSEERTFTSAVTEAADSRIFDGTNIATRDDLTFREKKAAIILAYRMNPAEVFFRSEAAILHGVTDKTLASRYDDKDSSARLPHRVNW